MKNIIVIIIVISTILLSACEKMETDAVNTHDVFYLRNNDADMPVHVKGNTASKTFILWIHGGPGDGCYSEKYLDQEINSMLEKDYAVVYWDQRCAGGSTGSFNPDDLSMDVMVEDLEKLVSLVKHIYGEDISLYLLGHSFGGMLSYAYLSKDNNQEQITGFINTSGPHSFPLMFQMAKTYYVEVAETQIGYGNNIKKWEEGIQKMENLDPTDKDDQIEISTTCYEAALDMEDVDSLINNNPKSISAKSIFGTPDWEMAFINSSLTGKSSFATDDLINIDLCDLLSNITLPVLFCSGKYDIYIPPILFQDAFERVQSDIKILKIFNRSGHHIYNSEPDAYYQAVTNFIDSTK